MVLNQKFLALCRELNHIKSYGLIVQAESDRIIMTTRKASRSTSMDRDDDSFDHYENASGISFPDRESISTRDNSDGMIVQEVQETRLVIGLDYGTTYTGMLSMQFW
jgi:hypothetical protein